MAGPAVTGSHCAGPGGRMPMLEITDPHRQEADILQARDSLQVMLIEYGDVHIETFAQLLMLTSAAEREFSRICIHRACGKTGAVTTNALVRIRVGDSANGGTGSSEP